MTLSTGDGGLTIDVRPYEYADAAGTLALFLAAITETASADYSAEQIQAWAAPQDHLRQPAGHHRERSVGHLDD